MLNIIVEIHVLEWYHPTPGYPTVKNVNQTYCRNRLALTFQGWGEHWTNEYEYRYIGTRIVPRYKVYSIFMFVLLGRMSRPVVLPPSLPHSHRIWRTNLVDTPLVRILKYTCESNLLIFVRLMLQNGFNLRQKGIILRSLVIARSLYCTGRINYKDHTLNSQKTTHNLHSRANYEGVFSQRTHDAIIASS